MPIKLYNPISSMVPLHEWFPRAADELVSHCSFEAATWERKILINKFTKYNVWYTKCLWLAQGFTTMPVAKMEKAFPNTMSCSSGSTVISINTNHAII